MYRFAHKRIVKWPVAISVVSDEGGKIDQVEISMQFELLTRTELAEIFGATDGSMPTGPSELLSVVSALIGRLRGHPKDRERLLDKVKGWDGVVDHRNGEPIEFTKDALGQALDADMRFYEAVMRGLIQASAGEAARKN